MPTARNLLATVALLSIAPQAINEKRVVADGSFTVKLLDLNTPSDCGVRELRRDG
jgi:hypothetical protein